MIKFLLGFGIIIVYSLINEMGRSKDLFLNVIAFIIILISCYYIGDLVLYKYGSTLS